MRIHSLRFAAAAMALALAACSGGGGSPAPAPAPANTVPRITGLANQMVNQDTSTGALSFTVNDAESGAGAVTVTASSSDASIVAQDAIVLTGTGGSRSIEVVPSEDATGSVNIAVTATDPQGLSNSVTFGVTVRAVEQSVAAFTTSTFAIPEDGDQQTVRGITFVQDADDPATFDPLLQ
jgi:hypothetical protein